MPKSPKPRPRDIEAEMVDLYHERGAATAKELLALGFTQEQIDTYGPRVAERLRLTAAA